jgi:hypothetical protein
MRETVKNVSASVCARLLNMSRSTGRNFQELVIRYVVERFLARLAESEHRNQFILKGAVLYIPWKLEDKRTTMDLDLLGFGSPDVEKLSRIFRQICDVEIADDGLVFDNESVTATPIREESVYDGVRIMILSQRFWWAQNGPVDLEIKQPGSRKFPPWSGGDLFDFSFGLFESSGQVQCRQASRRPSGTL